MAENVGGSHIEVTASTKQAEKNFAKFFGGMDRRTRAFKQAWDKLSPFEKMQWESVKAEKTIGRSLKNLPGHLKPFHEALNQTRREFRDLDKQAGKSLDEMADAAVRAGTSLEKATSVSDSGKRAIKAIDGIRESVKETQLAIMGLNKNGDMRISSEEAEQQMEKFRGEVEATKRELEKIRNAGDFASYEAGMEVLEQRLHEVDQAFVAASRGGETYNEQLKRMGIVTANTANQNAIAMERYKDKFLRSVDEMNAKATQSSKMIKILPEVSGIQTIDRFFLGIGDRLENMAKQGTAANIALRMLGPGASMKDLQDRISLINQGLGRMQALSIVAGIALAAFTAVMFNAAKGPSPADVLAKQAEALARYNEQLQERTNEIASTWALFEQVQIQKTNPRQLYLNLEQQVKVMRQWRQNLQTLSSKVPEDFALYLSKMGPAAAGEIAALTQMSDEGLTNYVAMWREKHQQANQQAQWELRDLKAATDRTVKELAASLTPLGIAIENFVNTWGPALQPFVDSWGYFAAKIVDAGTALGNFVNQVNAVNPAITAMAGNFLYLFTALTLILSPLAIGIGRAEGMRAAFTFVINTFRPLILGFLRVAGMASVVAAAIVIVVGIFVRMYQNSENLRNALARLWSALVDLGRTAAQPLIAAFKDIAAEFVSLINQMVGSKGQSMTSFWQRAGDLIAVAVDKITAAIKFLQPVFSVVFGFMATIVVSVFRSIVAVVQSGIAIITNTIDLFKNIAQGNFKAAWENIKNIFRNALIFIWNFMQLTFYGRMVGLLRGFSKQGVSILKALWAGIVSLFNSGRNFVINLFKNMTKTAETINRGMGNAILAILRALWNGIRGVLSTIFNFFKTIFSNIHSFVSGRIELTRNVLTGTLRLILSTLTGILRSLLSIFTSIFRSIWTTVTTTAKNIRTNLSSAWEAMRKNTSSMFDDIWTKISSTFTKIVDGAKALPGKIGQGIKKFGGYAIAGAVDLSNRIAQGLGKGVNGIINGVNWVLGKVGVDDKNFIPNWTVPKFTVPRYEYGTDDHKGGLALVNDQKGGTYQELIRTPDGQISMFSGRNVLANLPAGTSVLPAAQTKALLDMIPKYAGGAGDFFKGLWNGAKNIGGKIKDAAFDVWSYLDDPAKLLKEVFAEYVPRLSLPGALGEMVLGGMGKIKDGAVNFIKDKMSMGGLFGGGGAAPNVSGGVQGWRPIILQAARMMGEIVTPREVQGILAQIQRESGGNQRIVQSSAVVDVNTLAGNPARGLLQYIPQTFAAYRVRGRNNIYSGLDQLLAFFNNTNWRRDLPFGTRGWGPTGARKFAKGGFFLNGPEMGLFGEGGPEMALPLIGKNMLPYSEAVAQNLANIFSGLRAGTGADQIVGPFILRVDLNGRTIAEQTYEDIQDLQERSKARARRARGKA